MGLDVQLTMLLRLALAALCGFAIGMEREIRGKMAGDRTFALLAMGAAAVTAVGAELLGLDGASRTIQGVVTGAGFLGAGLIFRPRSGDVHGLTTAAGAWAVTAVGVLLGVGAYLTAVGATILVLVLLEIQWLPFASSLPRHGPPGGED